MPSKITYVIGSLESGGAERQMAMLVAGIAGRGHIPQIFALEAVGPLAKQLSIKGINIIDGGYRPIGRNKISKALLLLRAFARLIWHLQKTKPDTVHGFLPLTNFMASLAGRLTRRKRIIISKRGLGTHQDRHLLARVLDRFSNHAATLVTANSHAIAVDTEQRDGFPSDRILIIPNGLNIQSHIDASGLRQRTRSSLNISADEIAIINVANLIPYKGQLDLLKAFAQVVQELSNTRLILVGRDGGIQQNLEEAAERLKIKHAVNFLGQRDDVPALLAGMDVGVLPSHEEGLPNALIEKLAAGLPVVASDVGGVPEVCQGMPDAHLVRPKSPNDLAHALALLCHQLEQTKKNKKRRVQITAERFGADSMIEAYEHLYLS